jgi:outer membrane receptor protein involved in Fe transport
MNAKRLKTYPPLGMILASLCCLSSPALRAQTAPTAAELAKYDRNHDGRLDDSELSVMRTDEARAAEAVSTSATPSQTDDVVKLTPYQVDSSKDTGYYGANTLSGTRLNTKVQDLGGSITVVTKQQLEDTASVDINDVFKYEANTEGIYNYTAINTASPTSDQIQGGSATSGGPQLATRVRGISAPNITQDYFTHTARIPVDTYNIESIEISRGPNSTVAGLGSPSGTLNTNQGGGNVTRASNEVVFRVDSYGGYRSSFNLNRPLIKDKLAVRIAAVYANTEFKQKPSYDLAKRVYGAFTYKPFSGTTITGKAEYYRENRQAPNSLTPRDGVTEWLNSGKPTWNPLTFTPTINGVVGAPIPVGSGATAELLVLPNGLYANSNTYTRPNMYIDGGQVRLWEINRLGTTNNPNSATTSNVRNIASGSAYMRGTVNAATLYQVPGINNRALYDWTSVNASPTNWNYDRAATYTGEFNQKIINNLYFRAAWHLEDSVEYNRNITAPTLQVDVNQYLLDGRTNPYFLRPYISAFEPSIFRLPEYNDAVQAQLTYSFDLTQEKGLVKWLGRHQLGGLYENRRVTQGTFRYREAIIDPNHVWLTPGALNYTNGAAIGRPNYQYYVGPQGALGYTPGYTPPKSGVAGNFNLNWYDAVAGNWVSDPAKFGTATYVSSQTRTETHTHAGTWQGYFYHDQLVVTGGLRSDDFRTRNSNGAAIDGNSGLYTYDALKTWLPWTYATGPTRLISVVAYPFRSKWLGLTYSKSSSFQPQAQAVDLLGNILPNTYGHGQDVGFFTNLLKDKLVFSFKVYKTTVSNDRTANSTIGSRIARVEAGGLLPGTTATTDSFSLYEFAQNVARGRLGGSATQAQIDTEAAKITQFPAGFQNAVAANIAGAAIRGVADTEAKGAEVELTYSPSSNLSFKFTGAKTEAINTSLETSFTDYIASRMPYWLSVKDDAGNPWWTSTALGSQSAQAFYSTAVLVPLKVDQALLGKSNPQVKKYSWRLLGNYRFTEGFLHGFSVGGSARWDDRSVIGYLAGAPDSDGVVRTLDVNRGIYDPARYQFDFFTGYSMKLFGDRIGARFQLNLNNAFEGGGLRTVGVNPDGQPFNFRIINPRQLILTTTFTF